MKNKIIAVLGLVISTTVWAQGERIAISSSIPYLDDSLIAENIVKECTNLGPDLTRSLEQELSNAGYVVDKVEKLDTSKNLVLDVKIAAMSAGGSMFVGKQTGGTAKAILFKDGVAVKSKAFTRTSGGGVFGAYKGNCSILERITTVFGKDIAAWVKQEN